QYNAIRARRTAFAHAGGAGRAVAVEDAGIQAGDLVAAAAVAGRTAEIADTDIGRGKLIAAAAVAGRAADVQRAGIGVGELAAAPGVAGAAVEVERAGVGRILAADDGLRGGIGRGRIGVDLGGDAVVAADVDGSALVEDRNLLAGDGLRPHAVAAGPRHKRLALVLRAFGDDLRSAIDL